VPDRPPPSPEEKLDDTIEQTFPASDAPANTVETGIGLGEVTSDEVSRDADEPR
jgi:hypothetical protein